MSVSARVSEVSEGGPFKPAFGLEWGTFQRPKAQTL